MVEGNARPRPDVVCQRPGILFEIISVNLEDPNVWRRVRYKLEVKFELLGIAGATGRK